MIEGGCEHSWGESEEVEISGLGPVHSPICRHCGAAKIEVGRQLAERQRQEWRERGVAPAVAHARGSAFEDAEDREQLPPLAIPRSDQGRLAL